MKTSVKIDWKPAKIEKNLKKHKEFIQKGMESGLAKVVEQIAEGGQDVLSKRAATVGNKKIQESLSKGHKNNISKVFSHQKAQSGTNYPGANLVEKGTKPHIPPWSSIQEWVEENTGVLRISDVGSATYSFRQHIASKGTRATEFLNKGIKEKDFEIQKAVNETAENILKELGLK